MLTGARPERHAHVRSVPPGRWTIDPERSRVGFSVRHLLVATVRGRFGEFEGTLVTNHAGLRRASGLVQVASIETGEPKRDASLRGPDFFDAGGNPHIYFASRRTIGHRSGPSFRIVGDLTIKGATREIALDATLRASRNGARPADQIVVEARGEISLREFGLAWTEVFEAAGALVSDRVSLALEIYAVKAA